MSVVNISNPNYRKKLPKNIIFTILSCIFFILFTFSYTIIYKINHVAAMDSSKYHQAIDKYMSTDSYR